MKDTFEFYSRETGKLVHSFEVDHEEPAYYYLISSGYVWKNNAMYGNAIDGFQEVHNWVDTEGDALLIEHRSRQQPEEPDRSDELEDIREWEAFRKRNAE